jgi:FkbM family methyltransferase
MEIKGNHMLVNLLSSYYQSGYRGSFRITQLINKFYPLTDVDVSTPYGLVNVDLTISPGQGIAAFRPTPEGQIIAKQARGICYDIGANFGIYSVLMAQKCPVYAFEPNTKIFKHLENTAQHKDIKPFNVALADYNGKADFFVPEEATMGSLTDWTHDKDMAGITKYAGDVSKTVVQVSTMDDFVMQNNLPLPDFIKLDVEGAEISVFRGGRKTIEKSRPTIFFEVSAGLWEKMGSSHEEGFEFFRSLGYKLYIGDRRLDNLNLEWDNVLAIPD